MRTALFVLSLLSLASLAGCAVEAADTSDTAGSDQEEIRAGGKQLKNGADASDNSRPPEVRVTALAGDAKATLTDATLADCKIKEVKSLSTAKKTVFDITIDYQDDSGFNGCNYEFTAPGYKATYSVGEVIDD
jgi:hypothetical protein